MARPRIGITSSGGVGTTSRIEKVGRGYLDAVAATGGLPMVLPTLDPALAVEAVAGIDGLLLTGGGDVDPARYGAGPEPETGGVDAGRDAWEVALVDAARAAAIPVLAICRGAQVLDVAYGGTLVQHLPTRVGADHDDLDRAADEVHRIDVAAGSRLHEIVGAEVLHANTIHHQAVDQLGAGLVVSGRADDGVIEAIESPTEPILGVQWHPELLADRDPHRALFAWLVDNARTGR